MNAASRGNAYYEDNKKWSRNKLNSEIAGNRISLLDDINSYINHLERQNPNNLILKEYKGYIDVREKEGENEIE